MVHDVVKGGEKGNGLESDNELVQAERLTLLGNHELPIAAHREQIEAALTQHTVTILVAPTGSGKTTQVPQFARELQGDHGPLFDEIIVTQPRIVAARKVSERINEEISSRADGHKVGYYTSKEGTAEPQREQDIALLTDGKLLAQLLHERPGSRAKRRLVAIDEVHEWSLATERLIALVTRRTNPASPDFDPNLKVVLMSATMDSEGLRQHFAHATPPLIEVKVPTHPVTVTRSNKPVAETALKLAADTRGKVLAFLPGKREIHTISGLIAREQSTLSLADRVAVVPLHGQQTAQEQSKAFEDYPRGAVIATTNAAETSITVPNAKAVVDSGRVRVDRVSYDHFASGSAGLYLENAAQANLLQRKGRVGRTEPGQYVLCSLNGEPPLPFELRDEYATPAMQRSRLDGTLLELRAAGYQIEDMPYFHQPPAEAIAAARTSLFRLGALDKNGDITSRGRFMERLPLDPELACMLAFAEEQNYSPRAKQVLLDVAAIMQTGGILKRAPRELGWRELLEKDASENTLEESSDFLAQLEVYIELTQYLEPKDWGHFDIIEHSLQLVQPGRESLARAMGVGLHKPASLSHEEEDAEDRQAVLTAINAGQLSQLWQHHGESWHLVLEYSDGYELAVSSVVKLGQLATGRLFTLGLGGEETIDTVQDVNTVPSLETLEQAAAHLTQDVVLDKSTMYDPERGEFMVEIQRRLGSIVLRSFWQPLTVGADSKEARDLQSSYHVQLIREWQSDQGALELDDLEAIERLIAEPLQQVCGTNPLSGEPLYAWRGGLGWVTSRQGAIDSLQARKASLIREPIEAEVRHLKALLEVRGDEGLTPADTAKLEQLVGPKLRDDAMAKTLRFDPPTNKIHFTAERYYGKFMLRTVEKTVDAAPGTPETDMLRERYRNYVWQHWERPTAKNSNYDLKLGTIDSIIESPRAETYGYDLVTGEPLQAWLGNRGRWHAARGAAVNSLVEHKASLLANRLKQNNQALRPTVVTMRNKLLRIKKRYRAKDATEHLAEEALELLNQEDKSWSWVGQAEAFVARVQALNKSH